MKTTNKREGVTSTHALRLKLTPIALIAALAIAVPLVFSLAGCDNGVDDSDSSDPVEMVSLAGGTITGYRGAGAFIHNRTVTIGAFKIAKYETTWQLWKEVYDWAVANGYTFGNSGREGHGTNGTSTAGTTAERATRPVTYINWRDAIIWCNALSEKRGKTPVYYTNTTDANVLKVSTTNLHSAEDGAKMKPGGD
jgi:formylglycine-generating enzyme required for sulfatase activity